MEGNDGEGVLGVGDGLVDGERDNKGSVGSGNRGNGGYCLGYGVVGVDCLVIEGLMGREMGKRRRKRVEEEWR